MRIGLTNTTTEPAFTDGKIDGIGKYAKTLFDEYIKLHLNVTPITFPTFAHWVASKNISAGKILPLPFAAATFASLISPFANLIYNNMQKQFDIVHVTDHMIPRIKHVPVIATIHDALMFKHPEWYRSRLRRLKNGLRKETMRWASHFITISHAMVPELVEYLGIKEENISVVYNGLSDWWEEEVASIDKIMLLKKLGIPGKFILFTGTLQPKKNLPCLIQAYLELPADIRDEYPLVIAGKAGWDTHESLQAIHTLTSQNAGYWLDYVTDHEIRVLYQAAALYVFPSLHEGFGRTLLEAFASKTPAIVSTTPALLEIAQDAAYLVDQKSVFDIKHAMQQLLTNQTMRNDLIQKGSFRSKEFSLQKCALETLKIYEKIASR